MNTVCCVIKTAFKLIHFTKCQMIFDFKAIIILLKVNLFLTALFYETWKEKTIASLLKQEC